MIAILNSSLQVTDRFTPETQSLDLEERKSVSVVTTGMETPDIACGTWLRDETNPGKGIIWRVRSNEKQFDRKTKTLQLEHVINTLRDVLIFGELTPAMIAGGNATTCTARQAAQKVLSYQNIWVLGDFEFNVSNPYSFNGEDCFSAMETITSSLEGACWEYDLTRLPFRLHVRKLPEDVFCEMRMNRNIQTIRMTVDRSRMFTRFYPIGNDNLTLPGGYVSRNENLYGVISKTETDQSRKTVGELQAWANERLRNHSEPSVTVQISGMEWSEVTGEPLDSLQINKRCRVPLPEYGTFIREKVTKLRWANKIAEPKKVTVTLANLIADVASILNSASKSSARAGRTSAKKAEEDHAWFEDTTDHVAMVAEAVAGEGAAEDWSRVAAIVVDGNGIHQRVTKTEDDIVTAQTAIEANENAIILEAQRAAGAEGALSGRITVEADRITQEVSRASAAEGALSGRITVEADRITQEVSRATAAEGTLSGRITVEADRITQEVSRATAAEGTLSGRITVTAEAINQEVSRATAAEGTLSGRITVEAGKISQIVSAVGDDGQVTAASIVLAINNNKATAHIDADAVYIGNEKSTTVINGKLNTSDLTSDLIASKIAQLSVLEVVELNCTGEVHASEFTGGDMQLTGDMDIAGDAIFGGEVYADGGVYDSSSGNRRLNVADLAVSGNTLTITYVDGTTETFSKATSLSGAWSGNRFTVTASPQGATISRDITHSAPHKDTDGKWKVEVYATVPGTGTPPREEHFGHNINISTYLTNRTGSNKITANGTYNPSGSAIGFSAVEVDLPDPTISAGSAQGSAPSGATSLLTVASDNTDKYYKLTASCGGKTKDYYIKVEHD